MSDSIISMFFLGVLGILFVLLVVLTIVLIVTRKKDDEEEYDEDYDGSEDYDADDYDSSDYSDDNDYDDSDNEDDRTYDEDGDSYEDEEPFDEGDESYDDTQDEHDIEALAEDTEDDIKEYKINRKKSAKKAAAADKNDKVGKIVLSDELSASDTAFAKEDDADVNDYDGAKNVAADSEVSDADTADKTAAGSEVSDADTADKTAAGSEASETDTAGKTAAGSETSEADTADKAAAESGMADANSVQDNNEDLGNYSDELGDYSDSAFAPYKVEENIYNEEAIMASVKEAEAMSEAVIYGKTDTEAMFGISDELDSYKKKPVKKSTVSSSDEFYWYNKMDVAEKPSYKTKEMYYHYFNLPKDCIEELLVEMYDCALVRTEEIRYIAYGIEPKAVSIKDILSEGNYYYSDQPKKKNPMPQDLIKIYEKWCGYVDKLFDKVEIHADEFTIQEIRKMLCEFGRNDVDVILEGK